MADQNINIDGGVSVITDADGGADTYTILNTLSGNVTINDTDGATINLVEGLDIQSVSFSNTGVQLTINGFTVTISTGTNAEADLLSFVFGGTPLDPAAGTALDFEQTAAAFGAASPDTLGAGATSNGSNTGAIQTDGSVGGSGNGTGNGDGSGNGGDTGDGNDDAGDGNGDAVSNFTQDQDNIEGTDGDDTFTGRVTDNQVNDNTINPGDVVLAKGGIDRVNAQIDDSNGGVAQNFLGGVAFDSVEQFFFDVQDQDGNGPTTVDVSGIVVNNEAAPQYWFDVNDQFGNSPKYLQIQNVDVEGAIIGVHDTPEPIPEGEAGAKYVAEFKDDLLEGGSDRVGVALRDAREVDLSLLPGDADDGVEAIDLISISEGDGDPDNSLFGVFSSGGPSTASENLPREMTVSGLAGYTSAGLTAVLAGNFDEFDADDFDAALNIEFKNTEGVDATGGDGDDTLKAGDGNHTIDGTDGDDTIIAGDGDQTLTGGDGEDKIEAGDGDHNIDSGDGDDDVSVGSASFGSATINTGAGDDSLEINGDGNHLVDMEAGNDTLTFTKADLLGSRDELEGGREQGDTDTLVLQGDRDTIGTSETVNTHGWEVVRLEGDDILFDVTDNLIATADDGLLVEFDGEGGSVSTREIGSESTQDLSIVETDDAGANTVVVDDESLDGFAQLAFGDADEEDPDVLKIFNGGTYTEDDLSNISGLERIVLSSDDTSQEIWELSLTEEFLDNNYINNDGVEQIVIEADDPIPSTSQVIIDTSNVPFDPATDDPRILVKNSANLNVVERLSDGMLVPAQQGTGIIEVDDDTAFSPGVYELTNNPDNLTGTKEDDVFIARESSTIEPSDTIEGGDGDDTLWFQFPIDIYDNLDSTNADGLSESLLLDNPSDLPSISSIETVQFKFDPAGRIPIAQDVTFFDDLLSGPDDLQDFTRGLEIETDAGNDFIETRSLNKVITNGGDDVVELTPFTDPIEGFLTGALTQAPDFEREILLGSGDDRVVFNDADGDHWSKFAEDLGGLGGNIAYPSGQDGQNQVRVDGGSGFDVIEVRSSDARHRNDFGPESLGDDEVELAAGWLGESEALEEIEYSSEAADTTRIELNDDDAAAFTPVQAAPGAPDAYDAGANVYYGTDAPSTVLMLPTSLLPDSATVPRTPQGDDDRVIRIEPTDLPGDPTNVNEDKANPSSVANVGSLELDALDLTAGNAVRAQGTDSGDQMAGGRGNDSLFGNGGDDELFGSQGEDYLVGGEGDDELLGGSGDDVLVGGVGKDILHGQGGADVIDVGGPSGEDDFVVYRSAGDGSLPLDQDPQGGFDVILNFELGEDNIGFGGGLFDEIESNNNNDIDFDADPGEEIDDEAVVVDTNLGSLTDNDLIGLDANGSFVGFSTLVSRLDQLQIATDVSDSSAQKLIVVHGEDDTGIYLYQQNQPDGGSVDNEITADELSMLALVQDALLEENDFIIEDFEDAVDTLAVPANFDIF